MKFNNLLTTTIYFSAIVCFYFYTRHVFILNFLWIFHYLRRVFESLFLHNYSRGGLTSGSTEFSVSELIGGMIYYGGAGYFNAISQIPSSLSYNFIILFFIGEFGNFYHHYLLSKGELEKGLFPIVHKPHYTFELLTWFAWALLLNNLGSWLFFLASFGAMTSTAKKSYRKKAPYFMFPYIW